MVLLDRGTALCVALILLACSTGCARLFFHPMEEHVIRPSELGLEYQDVTIGNGVHGWLLPATGPARANILFLHGNAENISTHIGSVYWLPARGFNVLLLDYPGFGASAGHVSFEGAHEVIDAGIRYLRSKADSKLQTLPLIVFGQSMGGAISITAVADSPLKSAVCALVAESAFSSYSTIATDKLKEFWLTRYLRWPLAATVSDRFSPIDRVDQLAPIPLLLVHGDRDPIVGAHHSWRLYAKATNPKELWLIPGGSHIDAFRRPAARDRFVQELERLATRCRAN